MKHLLCLLLLSCLVILSSCNSQSSTKEGSNTQTQTAQKDEDGLPKSDADLEMNPKYPHIPKSEKGITVVNPNGWEEKTMEFHLGYCAQMVGNLENVDPAIFCECFLSKIQYYYEPVYFKEAYQDQTVWNQYCLKKAGI